METTEESFKTPTPIAQEVKVIDFGNIALSLSGGGYRAAAFHLGALDFLQQMGLLKKVTMLSTVSGGTITGAKYVLSLSRNQAFKDFYEELYNFLLIEERLPNLWLEKLHHQVTDEGKPSLIMAAAEVYDELLFKNGRFAEILAVKSELHLKEIIFNTTELRTGTNFRFQISNSGGRIGNGNIFLKEDILRKIRVADVVAASSCFPGGFEPLAFPYDFNWLDGDWHKVLKTITNSREREKLRAVFKESLALLDGGIYDNLGTEALLLANNRIKKKKLLNDTIGTLVILDSDNIQPAKSLFEISTATPRNWLTRITLKQLVGIFRKLFYLFLVSTSVSALYTLYTLFLLKGTLFATILIVWATIVFGFLAVIFGWLSTFPMRLSPRPKTPRASQLQSFTKKNLLEALHDIVSDWDGFLKTAGKLSIAEVVDLLGVRLQSIPPLFSAFLKRSRSQTYTKIYVSDTYRDKVISSIIRHLRNMCILW